MAEDALTIPGDEITKYPVTFSLKRPINPATGIEWDQTGDAARNMRYAHTLKLPELKQSERPRIGRAIIIGGAPSINSELKNIRKLAKDQDNAVFALNLTHGWLLERHIKPYGCVLFEIDAEPNELFAAAHPDVTYFICSHCHGKTFDQLAKFKRVLWHSQPNSPGEVEVAKELFPNAIHMGGGIGTFLRTMSVALCLGYRNFDIFGCDSSFPEDSPSTHVEGYKTLNDADKDSFIVYAKHTTSDRVRKFKTIGYLSLQIEEFKGYCHFNHHLFALRVHGDTLLRFVHQNIYPEQYTPP